MSILEMTNIKQVYNGKPVLDIQSFSLGESECVALVGPNGSGKTTLLNIAALLLPPTDGEVKIRGKTVNLSKPDKARCDVTLVSQEPYFFSGSLYGNMIFGMEKSAGRKEFKEQIYNAMARLGVDHLASRSPRTFSAGELKRAAIARAIVRKTPILLLDEPFANIDPQSRSVLHDVLKEISTESAIVYTTHDLTIAHRLSDRITTLQDGRISPWTPENLYKMKAHQVEDGTELKLGSGLSIYYPEMLDDGLDYVVTIDPSRVLLSPDEITSSAQNSYKGLIKRIESVSENRFMFKVECAEDFTVNATVTRRTLESFKSSVGDKVWVHFKSVAIHVFR